jgi:penicillin amidase
VINQFSAAFPFPQSGNPNSKFYSNLLPLWMEGKYFPLLFTREAVRKNAEENLLLNP